MDKGVVEKWFDEYTRIVVRTTVLSRSDTCASQVKMTARLGHATLRGVAIYI
jgi:hypothetical protein